MEDRPEVARLIDLQLEPLIKEALEGNRDRTPQSRSDTSLFNFQGLNSLSMSKLRESTAFAQRHLVASRCLEAALHHHPDGLTSESLLMRCGIALTMDDSDQLMKEKLAISRENVKAQVVKGSEAPFTPGSVCL